MAGAGLAVLPPWYKHCVPEGFERSLCHPQGREAPSGESIPEEGRLRCLWVQMGCAVLGRRGVKTVGSLEQDREGSRLLRGGLQGQGLYEDSAGAFAVMLGDPPPASEMKGALSLVSAGQTGGRHSSAWIELPGWMQSQSSYMGSARTMVCELLPTVWG